MELFIVGGSYWSRSIYECIRVRKIKIELYIRYSFDMNIKNMGYLSAVGCVWSDRINVSLRFTRTFC